MTIRAVVEHGLIRPLEPLPLSWEDGREVRVEDAAGTSLSTEIDLWYQELQDLGPAVYEPGEQERVEQVLREMDDQAKALVRREMGLN